MDEWIDGRAERPRAGVCGYLPTKFGPENTTKKAESLMVDLVVSKDRRLFFVLNETKNRSDVTFRRTNTGVLKNNPPKIVSQNK